MSINIKVIFDLICFAIFQINRCLNSTFYLTFKDFAQKHGLILIKSVYLKTKHIITFFIDTIPTRGGRAFYFSHQASEHEV